MKKKKSDATGGEAESEPQPQQAPKKRSKVKTEASAGEEGDAPVKKPRQRRPKDPNAPPKPPKEKKTRVSRKKAAEIKEEPVDSEYHPDGEDGKNASDSEDSNKTSMTMMTTQTENERYGDCEMPKLDEDPENENFGDEEEYVDDGEHIEQEPAQNLSHKDEEAMETSENQVVQHRNLNICIRNRLNIEAASIYVQCVSNTPLYILKKLLRAKFDTHAINMYLGNENAVISNDEEQLLNLVPPVEEDVLIDFSFDTIAKNNDDGQHSSDESVTSRQSMFVSVSASPNPAKVSRKGSISHHNKVPGVRKYKKLKSKEETANDAQDQNQNQTNATTKKKGEARKRGPRKPLIDQQNRAQENEDDHETNDKKEAVDVSNELVQNTPPPSPSPAHVLVRPQAIHAAASVQPQANTSAPSSRPSSTLSQQSSTFHQQAAYPKDLNYHLWANFMSQAAAGAAGANPTAISAMAYNWQLQYAMMMQQQQQQQQKGEPNAEMPPPFCAPQVMHPSFYADYASGGDAMMKNSSIFNSQQSSAFSKMEPRPASSFSSHQQQHQDIDVNRGAYKRHSDPLPPQNSS